MKKSKKKETLEEYLARGGVINKCPPVEQLEVANIIKPTNSVPENRLLSLIDGEFYFAETRTSKTKKKILLKDVIDDFGLPSEVKARLNGSDNEQNT